MEYPLVSAIITTHNRKDLVIKSIKSVMDQIYTNTEIIVVDDGSTDGTGQLIEKTIGRSSLKYIYNDKALCLMNLCNFGRSANYR